MIARVLDWFENRTRRKMRTDWRARNADDPGVVAMRRVESVAAGEKIAASMSEKTGGRFKPIISKDGHLSGIAQLPPEGAEHGFFGVRRGGPLGSAQEQFVATAVDRCSLDGDALRIGRCALCGSKLEQVNDRAWACPRRTP